VKTISVDNFLKRTVGELDNQGTVFIYINRQTFGYLTPGNYFDRSL
jgi:hypothetical protein